MSDLVTWLFETKAVRACPDNRPFWYTSGTIGPYYINTHFLYGSEELAVGLLAKIDEALKEPDTCSQVVLAETMANYHSNQIFGGTIDHICSFIKETVGVEQIDCISGGERRDWFFSLPVAKLLGKPHLTIFKDGAVRLLDESGSHPVESLQGKRVLHIADLITEASSYERAWIPAVKALGGEMHWSIVVVDRMQGGGELLAAHGVKSYALASVDTTLFDTAKALRLINDAQYKMLCDFLAEPTGSMRSFLTEHPEFLRGALAGDPKTAARAKLCLEKDFYGIKLS